VHTVSVQQVTSEEHGSQLSDATRRAILRGVGATPGVGAVGGVASGHPGSGDHGNEDHDRDVTVIDDTITGSPYACLGTGIVSPSARRLCETGWSRTHRNVVDAAKFGSLSAATPYHWCAIEENGVAFASCISTGVYAMTLDDPSTSVLVGTRTAPDVRTSVETDGSAFRGGATDQIDVSVSTQAPVEVRFQLPPGWSVAGGDHTGTWDVGDGTLVEFGEVDGDADLRLFATAPSSDSVRSQTLGPLSVKTDVGAARDQQVWETVPDTEQSAVVLSD